MDDDRIIEEEYEEELEPGEGDDLQDVQVDVELEKKAARMGHVPKEKFRGDPDKWVDAATFVKRAEEMLPIAKGTIETMHKKMAGMEQTILDMNKTFSEFNEHHKKTSEREYQRALDSLKKEREEAVVDGDLDKFHETEEKIEELGKTKPVRQQEPQPPQNPAEHPNYIAWKKKNEWYGTDEEATKWANVYGYGLINANPGLAPDDYLEMVTTETKARFPDKFRNSRRDDPATVGGGSPPGTGGRRGKTYADLPSDAKNACDRFVRTIPHYTREQYVKDYFGA